ncbi:ImmA/IrrE family metallo-endopeptidase [Rhizobium johnstonii]|uniref:ImmA/IrrE family metallo-endopeptidase n=1 Tax=Rhizobium TaxID=379 RepID=UPI001030CF22|nr:ImmA/IrrE family metallo-endopeptidase [Rhizobium ruizarguesonis]TBF43833.1 ImmA/IrrE family metallo-endopeptidase [Rhizobium leguminosarum]TBF85905.1 ImmA/IrrE family metallo-endopeptidase [Rhizobium leguminosarum]TBG26965.1 ImmA/IrrE family metallo-endopeptidase [Rhizobium leguminosarum]TBG28660.1 ImmA/IrrE family metallo-endopeptidase [Rhizobium leguminosarum]
MDFEPEVSGEVAGVYDLQGQTIYINKEIPSNHRTFAIAHELGHALLHNDFVKSGNYRG